jgi:alpha-glucosidase
MTTRPDWWKGGVVYQIYPRSFADSDGDGIGDLPGILAHLDHLRGGGADSLGVDAIWLSPMYPSPDFDFGYDVADYVGVDPKYGTLADFDRLVEECHARGLKVILDLVLNHTSHRHAWFEASRASRTGPFADWYIWRDSPGRSITGRRRPPNNWRSFFGGSAWTWEPRREQFYMHTFLAEQPDVNWRNPATRAALLDVVRTWLGRGVDGFRLDVFNTFFKDEALRSNPRKLGRRGWWGWQRHVHDRDQPELAAALAELRAIVDEAPGRMTVGELFDGAFAAAAGYTIPRHLTFDWALVGLPWDARTFAAAITRRDEVFGARWAANVLSNHDQPRHASRYDEPAAAGQATGDGRARVAAALLLTLRGTPFLYYGEELAMRGVRIPNDQALDPPARRASWLSPWWNRDQARGPMQWGGGPGGGFSSGRPWLPMAPDAGTRNVADQAADPASVLSLYRRLIELREATPALLLGDQELLEVGDADVLAYRRSLDGRTALVALNFASRTAAVVLPGPAAGRTWQVALSTHDHAAGSTLAGDVTLSPLEVLIAYD